jgi:hypothetical protein
MRNPGILGVFLIPLGLLLVPLAAMQFSSEVQWSAFDFVAAYVLLSGAGLAYKMVTRRASTLPYRLAAALGVGTALLLTWANLAVGVIGSENHPGNLLYFGVLLVGIVGAALARFEPEGMARALFATALGHALVSMVALAIWQPAPLGRWLICNAGFVALFTASGALFRHAARQTGRGDAELPA